MNDKKSSHSLLSNYAESFLCDLNLKKAKEKVPQRVLDEMNCGFHPMRHTRNHIEEQTHVRKQMDPGLQHLKQHNPHDDLHIVVVGKG